MEDIEQSIGKKRNIRSINIKRNEVHLTLLNK